MACIPKRAMAVKPSVWNQLVSAGMLRNSIHLKPVVDPVRRSM